MTSLQTSDGFTCPSIYSSNNISTVEMDPASTAGLTSVRLLADRSEQRNLQMEVIDKTNSFDASVFDQTQQHVVQIYFLKNRLAIHDYESYSKLQNIVIKDSFYSILGDKLKDFPQVVKKTPLISLQFFSQALERQTKIYNIKDNTKVQLTELKISREGYLYCMILPTNAAMKEKVMGLHVKYGIDALNAKAIWSKKIKVDDPNWVIYFNIDDLPFTKNYTATNYTFYYYSTDKRVEELAGATKVKFIDFNVSLIEKKSVSARLLFCALTWLLALSVVLH